MAKRQKNRQCNGQNKKKKKEKNDLQKRYTDK